jgi:hypothetical protein
VSGIDKGQAAVAANFQLKQLVPALLDKYKSIFNSHAKQHAIQI